MQLLKEYIEKYGIIKGDSILKVDSFLNHQIDPTLIMKIGEEFKKRFCGKKIDKILTIEASGIAIALATAYAFNVPLVFAKKQKPVTMNDSYNATVHSFTKKMDYNISVSKDFLLENENILIVDDFLAMGNAILGLKNMIDSAKANLVGVGIVIEKGFQNGSSILKEHNICLESLAIIESLKNGKITFK